MVGDPTSAAQREGMYQRGVRHPPVGARQQDLGRERVAGDPAAACVATLTWIGCETSSAAFRMVMVPLPCSTGTWWSTDGLGSCAAPIDTTRPAGCSMWVSYSMRRS